MKVSLKDLRAAIELGEDSTRQFKEDIRNADSLAAEMAAFANCDGGRILIGVKDDGSITGIPSAELGRINQLVSNTASQGVRSGLTVRTANVKIDKERIIVVVEVPKGIDKPYFDRNGVIWLKNGADKRRVHSKEELRRLFQMSHQFHADELPTKADIRKLDRQRFREFLSEHYGRSLPEQPDLLRTLLQNMNLAHEHGNLNLAGVLLFAEHPEWIVPAFVIKGISFPGTTVHVDTYLDSEDFSGSLPVLFENALAFVLRNLRKVQAGRGVNAPGVPEIPKAVLEELLVNALVHRDYGISAPIRVFIFDDRVEIISPGHLPNNLTVEKIKTGNSNIRNPILVSYAAKGLLPYHGIGSGITRALSLWNDIDFVDDKDGNLFTAVIRRQSADIGECGSPKSSPIDSPKGSDALLELMFARPEATTEELAGALGISKRAVLKRIAALKEKGRIRRVGPPRGGYWEFSKRGESDLK